MQSSYSWSQQSSVKENLHAWLGPESPPPPSQQVTISPAAQFAAAMDAAVSSGSSANTATSSVAQNVAAMNQGSQSTTNDPNLQLLILLVERMTGHKISVFDPSQFTTSTTPQLPDPSTAQTPTSAGYGVNYSKVSSYTESEQLTMQASGTINTTDGQQIKFSMSLSMQYQYSQTSSTSIRMGDAVTDPLVINFNGTGAQLSDQRFAFDLNSNGTNVQINAPQPGTGFLVLDKNHDGKINNGSELFGPSTGNGFSELAKYDANHNGWIDQADPVFNQLKVWTKDAAGNNQLNNLSSLGVGAISLQAIATPFDIKNATNQLLGSVQSSSVAVNENGTTDSVQQINLTA